MSCLPAACSPLQASLEEGTVKCFRFKEDEEEKKKACDKNRKKKKRRKQLILSDFI